MWSESNGTKCAMLLLLLLPPKANLLPTFSPSHKIHLKISYWSFQNRFAGSHWKFCNAGVQQGGSRSKCCGNCVSGKSIISQTIEPLDRCLGPATIVGSNTDLPSTAPTILSRFAQTSHLNQVEWFWGHNSGQLRIGPDRRKIHGGGGLTFDPINAFSDREVLWLDNVLQYHLFSSIRIPDLNPHTNICLMEHRPLAAVGLI